MSSALYQGDLMHLRHQPRRHQFRYRLTSWLIDIDQLAELDQLRLFGWNRAAPFSFHNRDYGAGDGTPPRAFIDQLLTAQGLPVAARVELLCQVRTLGQVFNPLAVWFCYNPAGELYATLYEVRNTFGGRHHYLVPDQQPGTGYREHLCDKAFHVSPFIGMNCQYRFKLRPPGQRLCLHIRQTEQGAPMLDASWRGLRQPLTDPVLWQQLLRFPFNSLKVITAIHWQALRLWLKGAVYRKGPRAPLRPLTIGHPIKATHNKRSSS